MQFRVSPHTHPESPISGSTVESMIDRAAKLGRTHFAYTDPAYMTSLFRAYEYSKKYDGKPDKNGNPVPKLGFIPGLEIFFKDKNCDIVKNTKAEKASYFKLTIYAQDQKQFQKLSELSSKERDTQITHYGETYPAWDWSDLKECAEAGLVACSSDVHDMVAKHLVTGTPQLGEKVLLKLKSMFGDNFYVTLVGNEVTHTWVNLIEFKLANGKTDVIFSNSRVSTNAAHFAQAKELVLNPNKHHILKSYQRNYALISFPEPGVKILDAKAHSGFFRFPEGDLQLKANKFLYALAKKHGIKVLYSDYAFYSTPEDKAVQDVRLSQDDIKEHTKRHMQTSEEAVSHLKKIGISDEEISKIFAENDEWAKRFDNFSLKFEYRLPEVSDGRAPLEACLDIIKNTGRLPNDPVYFERLQYEISVIAKNGKIDLTSYFLPIRDVFDFYEQSGRLTGPARGSAGGSLFLYLMGITHIDPIKYKLSFERFLSINRILNGDMPDVDVDLVDREPLVGPDGRSGYLYGRWGDKAAQISTRIQLRLKSAIRDVNKYLNNGTIDPEIERLSKALPPPPQGVSDKDFAFGFEDSDGNHIPGLIEVNPDLQRYAAERPKEWELVQRCLGISRQNSKHASAFVIADVPIKSIVPIFMGNITQYEAKSVEKSKLIKYDFLVVNQLKDIEGCINRINKKHGSKLKTGHFMHNGKDIYIWNLPEEQEVFASIWGGDTQTLFQINTQSMVPFVMKIKPKSIVDLAIILALVRPGPLDFVDPDTGLTMADEYIERRNGRGTIKIPELVDLLPETYGVQCIAEGSLVKTDEGLIPIEKVKVGQKVQTENGQWHKVLKVIDQGHKKTYRIRTDYGQDLIATEDHKVLTQFGWKEVRDLTNNDLIKAFWLDDQPLPEGDEKDYFIGSLLALLDKENLVGKDCHIIKWPSYISKQMILGYIDGSGNRENRTIKTTNKDLATGLLIGLHRMKIKSYMTEDEPGVYRVSWSFDFTSTKIDSGFDTTQQWAKVIKVEKENDNQKVWDLSIEEVHSFIVGGLVVHNCFQEQTTLVAREIGKMKPTDAEELRRIFSKKQKAKALAMKPLFMEGAVKTVGQEKAEMIWSQMETSSRYSFNLSHASAYAMITYACMYLRYHYPMEWWASVLTNADESEISTTLFKHVRDKVVPPDINTPSNEMEIDYDQNKIRAKMTVLKGLGEAVAEPIVKGAPYSDIKDFVRKKVAGPSLTRRLIHVGVMDSLFPKGASLLEKMQIYEDAVLEVAYEEKIASGKKAKAPGRGKVDPQYLSMGPLQDFKAKKMILPTLPMNLSELVVKFSPIMNEGTLERPMFADDKGRAQPMLTGDQFHEVEKRAPFERPMYFCVPAYIVDMKEFNFNKNEKKALKMTVDIDGRISERVMWPAWGENVVVYPKELKKHSIVLLFMTIKEGRTEVKIYGIKILS